MWSLLRPASEGSAQMDLFSGGKCLLATHTSHYHHLHQPLVMMVSIIIIIIIIWFWKNDHTTHSSSVSTNYCTGLMIGLGAAGTDPRRGEALGCVWRGSGSRAPSFSTGYRGARS